MRAVSAIVEPAFDAARDAREVQAAVIALQDAERQEKASTKRAEHDREESARRRFELGRLLCEMRKHWPARGPKAKGWGDFLLKCGLEQSTAFRLMQLAGYVEQQAVSCTDGDVHETPARPVPTYADAGIDKRPRKADLDEPREVIDDAAARAVGARVEPEFHILIAIGDLQSVVKRVAARWPVDSRKSIPEALRALADDLEQEWN